MALLALVWISAGQHGSLTQFPGLESLALGQSAPVAAFVPTFHKDIAPILHRHCTPCHRPGAAGPFPLITFEHARKHAREIVDTTSRRRMPPWLPSADSLEFRGTRGISDLEIHTLKTWLDDGLPEGDRTRSPTPPTFPGDWILGTPDLVVELPEDFVLDPDGPDVYRNFTVPIPTRELRYVATFEFQPRNPAVHHARIQFDPTGQCRHLDERDPAPGFDGMNSPARYPPGHMLTWAPGRDPNPASEAFSWPLEPRSDLVLQLHLQRTGRRENIRPRIGFHFSNNPPTHLPAIVSLTSQTIDIPPGATDHVVTRSVRLPCPVDLLSLMPHAHQLATSVNLVATFPDGSSRTLLRIPRWDFRWQGEYILRQPLRLPQDTELRVRFAFDNSSANPVNPNRPPRRTRFGPQTTDEMAELHLQLLPANPRDLPQLLKTHHHLFALENIAFYQEIVRERPADPDAHLHLGRQLGSIGRHQESLEHFIKALESNPDLAEAYQGLGIVFVDLREWIPAREAFEAALRRNPSLARSHLGLGVVATQQGRRNDALHHFKEALRLDPADASARRAIAEWETAPSP